MGKSSIDGDYSSEEDTNQEVDKKNSLAGKQSIMSNSIKSKLLQFVEFIFGPDKQHLSTKILSINLYQFYCLVNHY